METMMKTTSCKKLEAINNNSTSISKYKFADALIKNSRLKYQQGKQI